MEHEEMRGCLKRKGYLLRELLGQGGFSRVYRVERAAGGEAACKVSGNAELLRRESEILKSLKHPLFPECYEFWQEGETAFLLMELVRGENLGELIRKGERFTARRAAELGAELAEGLLYLHDRRNAILFRDLKPENILLREDGQIKLLDFGCVCVQGEENKSRAGTPGYAAPEQLAPGGRQTILCDVYGLGKTLLALPGPGTAGRGRTLRERREHREERRSRRKLERLLCACVEDDPSARPADMRVVLAALFPICSPGTGGGGGKLWQEGIVCEKNIWKSGCKTI